MRASVLCLGVVVLVIDLCACGPFPRPADLPIDGAVDTAAPRCNPAANFGAPVALSSLNTLGQNEQANLSEDELTIYFASTRAGGAGGNDIYQATRASQSAPFGNIIPVSGVNTTGEDDEPRVTMDGLMLFAISKPVSEPGYHITLATRLNTAVAFGALQPVANVNSAGNDIDPYILASGNVLYFASDRSGNFELYRSSKAGGAYSAPSLVSGVELNLTSLEANPVVTADELTLFFTSTRPGGVGIHDIYMTTRPTLADSFGAPLALTTLNSAELETPNWISPDGCVLYLTRVEPSRGRQLYVATRGQ